MTHHTHGFIRTFTGQKISLSYAPEPSQIFIQDIAHALAYQSRWGGHGDFGKHWYSVAEHSVLVALVLMERTRDAQFGLTALLHDAPEAYIVDVPRPVKRRLKGYADLELMFAEVIGAKFRVSIAELPSVIVDVDNQILHNEANRFMNAAQRQDPEWILGTDPIPGLRLSMFDPPDAEELFLRAFTTLTSA